MTAQRPSVSPLTSDVSAASAITSTLTSSKLNPVSSSASSSGSDDDASGDDSDDESDSDGMQLRLKELLLKAKAAARAATLATSTQDSLAGQDELVRFGDDDESSTPHASSSKLPSSLLRPVQLVAPTALSLLNLPAASTSSTSKNGITLGQDLAGLIDGASTSSQGDKWGKPPIKSLSKKEQKARHPRTAGPQWFNMPAPEMTPELKREIQAMKLRNSLDPKRFYRGSVKADKAMPEFFSVGHIVSSSQGASTASQQSAVRKRTFVEELVEDEQAKAYTKRKTREVMERGMSGRRGKMHRKTKRA